MTTVGAGAEEGRTAMGYDLAAEPRGPRRWPWVLAGLLVVLVIAGVVVAAVTGRVLPYQADREELTGTPFVLRVQAGVPFDEEDRVRAGLVASHALLDERLGGDVTTPVEVRVTWSQGCEPLLGPTSVGPAWSDDELICLNASHPEWRGAVERSEVHPALAVTREHVHVWQRSLGCHVDEDDELAWLDRAMADQLALAALVDGGLVPRARAPTDALSATGLADVCAAVGQGQDWDTAVRDGLGVGLEGLRARIDGPGEG